MSPWCSHHVLARGVQADLIDGSSRSSSPPEHVPEEMVVAVPLAASVERHEEQVRSVDLVEHSSRVGALENIVTHSCRQAIEHR